MQTPTPQLTLPGQAYTAQGPIDLNNMYVLHHAFRRDLDRFSAAAAQTPLEDSTTWSALADRWARFGELLHTHHEVEDKWLWPSMLAGAEAAGDGDALATIEGMQEEHGGIDRELSACTAAFQVMRGSPDAADRERLVQALTATRDGVCGHLAHEETDALPVLQQYLPPPVWEDHLKALGRTLSPRTLLFIVPWGASGLSRETLAITTGTAGWPMRILLKLTQSRFEANEQATFRYAGTTNVGP
jgi:iron-sulfur cluster repair protein YtfE (RIC family)